MLFLWALVHVSSAYSNDRLYSYRREFTKPDFNFNQTLFSTLESYQVNASPVSEDLYPWIARVVHSKKANIPHVCTASCIADGIFITASRCVSRLKVKLTTLIYQSQRLQTRAIVIPSESSKQAYDDIGFIVVHKYNVMWRAVQLVTQNRTDEGYRWFEKLAPSEYKVIGYATEKGIHKVKSADRIYSLTELDVVIGLDICSTILTNQNRIEGFNVPCYHSCTTEEFYKQAGRCHSYHGVEGGAVIDKKNNVLLGVATWGPYFRKYELPVGFSVVNSRNFFQDYECAKTIWSDGDDEADNGYYQKLCTNLS